MSGNGYDGHEAHRTLLLMARAHLECQGWAVQEDRSIFGQASRPFIPDLVATRSGKVRGEWGRKGDTQENWLIEIEMHPTAASLARKHEHAKGFTMWTLKILDGRKIPGIRKGWDNVRIGDIKAWLNAGL